MEDVVVNGITLNKGEAKITICNVPDRPGVAAQIFKELSNGGVNIDTIVQNVSHKKITDISFTVPKKDCLKTLKISKMISKDIGAGDIILDEKIAKVSLVGVGMRSHSGVAAKCFSVLAKNKINIDMISTSEISISCVVKKEMGKKALKALHRVFKLNKI